MAIIIAYIFLQSVSINNDNNIQYAEKAHADTISCSNGDLCVNDVVVAVPVDENPSYSISYSWAEDDTDYPSVPIAAIASYNSQDGIHAYDISLYKDSFIPSNMIPVNKNASNWFDDWAIENYVSDVEQGKLNSGDIHGFFISSVNNVREDEDKTYATYSYYFAAKSNVGITVYILEGVLYDSSSSNKLLSTMTKCIKNISINNSAEDSKSSAMST